MSTGRWWKPRKSQNHCFRSFFSVFEAYRRSNSACASHRADLPGRSDLESIDIDVYYEIISDPGSGVAPSWFYPQFSFRVDFGERDSDPQSQPPVPAELTQISYPFRDLASSNVLLMIGVNVTAFVSILRARITKNNKNPWSPELGLGAGTGGRCPLRAAYRFCG